MKLKALLLACAVAGFCASFALADDGHGKHHDHGTTTGTTMTTTAATTTTTAATDCTKVELRGTFASVSASSFTLTVTKAELGNDEDDDNNATPAATAASLVGQTLTIAVDPNTRVSFRGVGTLTGPNVGDTARVNALSCGSPATLTAQSVKAQGANAGMNSSRRHESSHK